MSQSQTPQDTPSAQSNLDHLGQFTDEELAYHEAGHAVIHVKGGGIITRLSIVRTDPAIGTHADSSPPKPATPPAPTGDPETVRHWIDMLLAGEATGYVRGRRRPESSVGDRKQAFLAARTVAKDDAAAQAMVDAQWDGVVAQLRDPATWRKVETLAGELTQRGTLDGDEIARLLGSA